MRATQPDLSTGDGCYAFQLINKDAELIIEDLEGFETKIQHNQNLSYAMVAIIGPQSSGKSTLLNHLFDTKFTVMDSSSGRPQTTQGIWLACPNMQSKDLMLVMDIEGIDGSEREDDTTFEKRSALFALAVANVVIVNIWYHDIGREQAAGKPLLEVVFQQVKIKFSDKPRKIKLMFVIRDNESRKVEVLEKSLRADIGRIWASIPQQEEIRNISLDEVFDVQFVFLPHYVYRNEDFKTEVQKFKGKLVDQCTAARDEEQPASGFSTFVQTIWEDIKENKNLDLPAHKVMVATIRCDEIESEKYAKFEINKAWLELRKATQLGNFRDIVHLWNTVNSVLNTCVSEYDQEAFYFVEEVRIKKRKKLVKDMLQLVEPVYRTFLNELWFEHLNKFTEVVDRNSDNLDKFLEDAEHHIQICLNDFKDSAAVSIDLWQWDPLTEMAELECNVRLFISGKSEDKLALKIKQIYEPKLKQELSHFVVYFLCEETDPTWSKIREHYKDLMNKTVVNLKDTFSNLGMNEDDQKEKEESLKKYAEDVIVAKAREESGRAGKHMTEKFKKVFIQDSSNNWKSDEDVEAAAKNSVHIPLMLLAGLVAIRLEDSDAADNIQYILASALLGSEYQIAVKDLESDTWAQIHSSKTLITPKQCKESWQCFLKNATRITSQVLADLKREQKKKPKREQFLKVVEAISSMLAIAASLLQMIVTCL